MEAGPVLVSLFFFVVVALIWGGAIMARHKERMTMLEKGLSPEDVKALYQRDIRKFDPVQSLKWGILLVSVGIGILLGMWIHNTYAVDDGVAVVTAVLFGGIGLIVFYFIAARKRQE